MTPHIVIAGQTTEGRPSAVAKYVGERAPARRPGTQRVS